jgi:hypothetical protein
MSFILGKLKEKSTYAGLAALLAAFGWSIDPETFSAGAAAIIAIVGLWEVLRRESK